MDACYPEVMKRGRLLFVLWCSNIIAVSSSFTVENISCVSDYDSKINCALNISDDLGFKSKNYKLKFKSLSFRPIVSCPLVGMGHSYHGDYKLTNGKYFGEFDRYNIELCYNSTCQDLIMKFNPSKNIKLSPPPEVVLQHTPERVNITCKSERYKNHKYLKDKLKFDVLLQDSHGSQNKTFFLDSTKTFHIIDQRSLLKKDANYCIKARFIPNSKTYSGTWSEWSKPTCWQNTGEQELILQQSDILIILLKYLAPVCMFAGLLLVVFYSPAARMKIKTLSHTPNPAPFFQPLFQKHEGNLQDWLSHHSKLAQPYKTEKDFMADAVTVVPKPVTKDPQEGVALLCTSVSHLTFPQNQTSYIGLPGMQEGPSPMAMVCPGDTPYTQLPCSVWGFDISHEDVLHSAPKDFLELSQADSGCSCEALTQSPEFSLPSSPVDESAPPLYCNDYCFLNKTAEGVVPVLLSKEKRGSVPLDSWKAEG